MQDVGVKVRAKGPDSGRLSRRRFGPVNPSMIAEATARQGRAVRWK